MDDALEANDSKETRAKGDNAHKCKNRHLQHRPYCTAAGMKNQKKSSYEECFPVEISVKAFEVRECACVRVCVLKGL